MMYNVVKAELISNKSEWSMGVVANESESKCVKLTLENGDFILSVTIKDSDKHGMCVQ